VNTGEVIAGDASLGQAFATGDTVNVAARFEQAATPGSVLIGESTYRLVRDAVRVEPMEPLELKGNSERLPGRRADALLTSRGGEGDLRAEGSSSRPPASGGDDRHRVTDPRPTA
jgi:hypothetical protein